MAAELEEMKRIESEETKRLSQLRLRLQTFNCTEGEIKGHLKAEQLKLEQLR
jgi:hypothetical protein